MVFEFTRPVPVVGREEPSPSALDFSGDEQADATTTHVNDTGPGKIDNPCRMAQIHGSSTMQ